MFLLEVTHFVESCISLVVTNSQFFFFVFIWNITLMYILVYSLESYEYFRRVFIEVYVTVL